MTTPGPSPYSYYASQTVRTLRGILDAGVSATGWSSSSSTTTNTATTSSSFESANGDTLREPLPEMQRHVSGGGKRSSRPGIGQLFDDGPPAAAVQDTRVVDQPAAKVEEARARHKTTNNYNNSSNNTKTTFNLDRVLFHTGSHVDPYDPDSAGVKIPLLALCPCNLPSEVTDLIAAQLSARLDSYAQEPYMLVVFASPSNPVPVQHLIRYYRALTPEVRRNIARLWICHAGLFTKIAVRLFLNTIVSGKVTRKGKVKLVDSLNALGQDIALSQVEIPPQVLVHDAKVNGKLSLASSNNKSRFGASLSEVMMNGKLPRPVSDAIHHLRASNNLQTVGLFRKTPSLTLLEVLKTAYESNVPITLSEWPDNSILAGSILKTYLRNLKYPLFPSSLYEIIKRCPAEGGEAVQYIREVLVPKLVEHHPDGELALRLLKELLRLLRDVALQKDTNQMDSHNLATVFLPVLVRSADIQQDVLICTMPRKMNLNKASETLQRQKQDSASLGTILKLCIERYDDIFPGEDGQLQSSAMTPDSSTSTSTASHSSTEPSSSSSNHDHHKQQHRPKTVRNNRSTLRLLGSPGTVKKNLNGKTARSEASRESARGLFARE